MMKALVTLANAPAGLFVVRRLHALGYKVTVVDSHTRSYASYSNGVSRKVIAPSLHYDPHGFAKTVINELQREQYDLYFPVMECGFLMSYYKDIVQKYTKMVTMSYEDITFAHNKGAMRHYAEQADVPMPVTQAPASLKHAYRILEKLDFPVVIKPQVACNANGQKIILDTKNAVSEYGQLVKKHELENQLPIIQQFIKGTLVSTVNLAVDGEIKGQVVFRALRTVPTSGGTSSYRETVSSPEAELFDARLIKHLNWTGFICFDYMEDEATGKLYLIDCNPRIAAGVILGHFAGVDLMGAFAEFVKANEIPSLPRQQDGIRCKLNFLDIGWLLYNLIDKNLTAQQKFECFKTWSKPEKKHSDTRNIHDLRPSFALWAFLLPRLGKLLGSEGGEIFLEHSLFDEEAFQEGLAEVAATVL